MSVDAYKLWYEYLKVSDQTKWSEAVRKDFGGVLTKDFDEWIRSVGLQLFAIFHNKDWYEQLPVRVPLSQTDQEWINDWFARKDEDDTEKEEDEIEPETHTVLIIDLSHPRDVLMKQIERMIKRKQVKRSAGSPKWKPVNAKYPLARRPNISSLEIALAAWKLRRDNTDWKKWQIANELSKRFDILRNDRIKENKEGQYDDLDIVQKQKELDKAGHRYLKMADAVMAGVVKGIFPAK